MLQRSKLAAAQMLSGPKVRAILIMATVVIAVLAGGAPHDVGGGG
jgi:hypothetical protein